MWLCKWPRANTSLLVQKQKLEKEKIKIKGELLLECDLVNCHLEHWFPYSWKRHEITNGPKNEQKNTT